MVHDDEPLLFPLRGQRIVCAAQNKRFRQMLCANGVQKPPARPGTGVDTSCTAPIPSRKE